MVPCSIWIKKTDSPIAKPGSVSVDFKDYAVDDEVIFQYRQKKISITIRKADGFASEREKQPKSTKRSKSRTMRF